MNDFIALTSSQHFDVQQSLGLSNQRKQIIRCYPTNEALKPLIGIEKWCSQLCTTHCPPTLCACVYAWNSRSDEEKRPAILYKCVFQFFDHFYYWSNFRFISTSEISTLRSFVFQIRKTDGGCKYHTFAEPNQNYVWQCEQEGCEHDGCFWHIMGSVLSRIDWRKDRDMDRLPRFNPRVEQWVVTIMIRDETFGEFLVHKADLTEPPSQGLFSRLKKCNDLFNEGPFR